MVGWSKVAEMRPGIDKIYYLSSRQLIVNEIGVNESESLKVICLNPEHPFRSAVFVHAVAPPAGGAKSNVLSSEQLELTERLIGYHLRGCKHPNIMVTAYLQALSEPEFSPDAI